MKEAKIEPLSILQYLAISDSIDDEIERVVHAGMIAAKCTKHPEFGDIILISSTTHTDCLMIRCNF
ncbi:MAG: hypothetical protein NTY50_10645 [Methylobacter sp.]|nr:hypothetical protein [Methylobacter sp.]